MLATKNEITWCPGCPNFLIKRAVEKALGNLMKDYPKEDFVIVTDIGCSSKMYDYINLSGFYGLHGRAIPAAFGMAVANPKLKIMVFAGDGGTYNEGISHFIHACRYNADMTIIVHNNQVFSLTTGQSTATTETDFVEKTHPYGVKEKPVNPVLLALESGAGFVARASALDIEHTAKIIEEAVRHPGFSFVDILQPCLTYHDNSKFLKENTFKMSLDSFSFSEAVDEARKWDYNSESKVGIGIFFNEKKETFAEKYKLSWK